MFEVSVSLAFSAAHRLPGYPGDCRRLHGHNWRVVVSVRARELDELGMVADFRTVKEEARKVLAELDHTLINDHPDFRDSDPSSEALARWIFERLRPALDAGNHRLQAVEVWETENSGARYEPTESAEPADKKRQREPAPS